MEYSFEMQDDEVMVRQSPHEEERRLLNGRCSSRAEEDGVGGGGDVANFSLSQSPKQSRDITPPPNRNNFHPVSFSTPVQETKNEHLNQDNSSLNPEPDADSNKSLEYGTTFTTSTSSNPFRSELNHPRLTSEDPEMWAPWSAKPTRSSPPPKKRVSFNLSPEQEAKSPTPHPRFSHDPPSLENSVETGISEIGQPLFNSSILSNNSEEHNLTLLNSLDSSQLRSTLEDVLQQNTSLKLEVENKARQLQTAKRQMKALIDLEPSMPEPTLSGNEETQFSLGCASKSCPIQNSINSMTKNVSELGQDEVIDNDSTESNSRRQSRNDYPIPGILPEHTFILIREITSRIEVHQVRERMVEGLQFSNQFAIGGATGWLAAYLIKNFGKTALTAAGGGALIMAFATRKGFVEVNWNRVFLELQKRGGTPTPESRVSNQSQSPGEEGLDEESGSETSLSIGEDWTVEKIHKAKTWIVEHSVAAAGFASGFLYSVL